MEQIFLVSSCQLRSDVNRKPYLLLSVRDVTAEIQLFAWGVGTYVKVGSYIFANAQAKEHKNQLVLTTNNITVVPKPHNLEPFVRSEAASKLEVIGTELDLLVGKIYDGDLSEIIGYLRKLNLLEQMKLAPYAGKLNHAGGLLIHTFNLLKLCLAELQATAHVDVELNRDLIVAACLCRNLGYMNCSSLNGDVWTLNRYGELFGIGMASWSYTRDILIGAESDLKRSLDSNKKWDLLSLVYLPDGSRALPEGNFVSQAEGLLNSLYATNAKR